MKKLYILLLIVIMSVAKQSFAQNIDSLKLALKNAKHDTTRCNILSKLAESADENEWPVFNEQLLKLAEKGVIASPTTIHKTFYLKHIAIALNNIGFIYDNQGNISKALEYYHKSLKISEEIKDKHIIAGSLNNIGAIYNDQGDISNALEYFHKSLKIKEEIKEKEGIATTLSNIGAIYYVQGDIPKALEYYQRSLKIQEEIKDKIGIGTSLVNIGTVFFYTQDDITKGLEYYQRSLKIMEEIKDKSGISTTLNSIASAMLKKGQVAGALDFALKSMKTAKELGYPENIKNAASTLKEIYQKQNMYKEAFEMYELEIQMRDSINNEATKKASIQKQFQYQYEKKSAADSVANAKANEIKNAQIAQQKAEIRAKRNQQYALYGGVIMLIAFLGFIYNRLQLTNKQKQIIEEQKHIVEEKNHDITQSIQYAQKIQAALLPSEEIFKTILPDSFVLFKPKDIVSGDFYWLSDRKDYVYYATADCTGHGVPGGFMSMLGTALFNEIIDERKVEKCGDILTLMREKIMQALKQAGDSESKDGMDMVLIRIDKNTLEMQYAAANNSLYIVSNIQSAISNEYCLLKTADCQLFELPCDKMPVGVYHSEVKPFQTFTCQLQKGDTIYTYTDGYADQFGGEKGKKYTYKRLREKLLYISQEPLVKQKDILDNEFENWKGNNEQVDDVCLIGVKI